MNKILVIHVNHFTRKIDSGYLGRLIEGKITKEGNSLTPKEVIQALVDNPKIQVDVLKV